MPSQKPGRRPRRVNTNPAGIEPAITADIWIAIGKVAKVLSAASSWPTSAAITTCPDITANISA